MELHQILRMNGGEGEASYAKNSSHQKLVLMKVKPFLVKSIQELMFTSLPECLKVADLGCSSGPNTFLTLMDIIESIDKACNQLNCEPPMIQVYLNDLVGNDFNSVFKMLPSFFEKLEKENGRKYGSCLIAAMPGSFYGRLFPRASLHFVHSSYCLHWLSQVPEGLVTESGIPLNKRNIHVAKTSPPGVHQAYLDQFTKDFTMFLRMRSDELVPHGHLLLTLISNDGESDGSGIRDLITMALNDMVDEGHVEEEKLESFNIPFYTPSFEEVKDIIEKDGSFKIQHLEMFKLRIDASFYPSNSQAVVHDEHVRAAHVARFIRAVFEPILASHFGEGIMDDLFHRFAKYTATVLQMGKGVFTNLVISLVKE